VHKLLVGDLSKQHGRGALSELRSGHNVLVRRHVVHELRHRNLCGQHWLFELQELRAWLVLSRHHGGVRSLRRWDVLCCFVRGYELRKLLCGHLLPSERRFLLELRRGHV